MTFNCPCNILTHTPKGGGKAGGSAIFPTPLLGGGGGKGGGSVEPDIVGLPYHGMAAIWPLDEEGNGTTDEYRDRSANGYHGTGGTVVPELIAGMGCLGAQYFEEDEFGVGSYISLPQDTIPSDHSWSVSMWVKVGETFNSRTIYSRGHIDQEGNQCVWSVETSILNHIVLSVWTDEGLSQAFSDVTLSTNKFYHIAAAYDGSDLVVYVNGAEGTKEPIAGTPLTIANGGYFGRQNYGSYFTGSMQEVRLFPSEKRQAYFLAEYDSFCSPMFISIGEEETAA